MHTGIKHPISLRVFFATEMWERYGFYVVQSLLALYLAKHYHWSDKNTYALVGSFTALTYLSPVVGGWVADHILGQKRTVLSGAVFLFFSYITLTVCSSKQSMLGALAGIAVGTGLLKSNISSLLGNEYPVDSPKRESGFTIFYMGITTGIILGTTVPSYITRYFGWPATFASAAFGMLIAFAVFLFGIKRYRIADYQPFHFNLFKLLSALILIMLLWLFSVCILSYSGFADFAFLAIVALSSIYLLYTASRESGEQAQQTLVIGILCIISVMFWTFYFQMFLSLTLFIARVVEPKIFGIPFPPPYYVSVQSAGMIVFGYLLVRKKSHPNSEQNRKKIGDKFVLSLLFMSLSYGIIMLVCRVTHGSSLLSPLYFIPAYLLISIAELFLSPVGLSAVTILASRHRVSTMMGIFFVSLGTGGYLSGKLAGITAISNHSLPVSALKEHYAQGFTTLFLLLVTATIVCYFLNRVICRLMAVKQDGLEKF
ncbi:peptide MFS transporter [Legionella spiritensis]|uniref:POT family transporter protein proton/peptide symporter n=2 Tax=Legionella spiritensis TaxID=452 RepID=A0A0W0Z4I8_LEGSP|nr:peptide MFS transporter [Legionella spiritensis]KTD64056.1 POT family transporter protein proton/peptide symporter [Legionella spiritensis]SNV37464.1 proton/peptide symporter, POT family protein [Legionella spiritensis]